MTTRAFEKRNLNTKNAEDLPFVAKIEIPCLWGISVPKQFKSILSIVLPIVPHQKPPLQRSTAYNNLQFSHLHALCQEHTAASGITHRGSRARRTTSLSPIHKIGLHMGRTFRSTLQLEVWRLSLVDLDGFRTWAAWRVQKDVQTSIGWPQVQGCM